MPDWNSRHIVRDALFLDIPYIIDSFTRHAEYGLNRLHPPSLDGTRPTLRSYLALPSFALLLVVLFLTAYGPTYNAVCGLVEPAIVRGATHALGWVLIGAALFQFVTSIWYFRARIKRRFEKMELPLAARYRFVQVVFFVVLAVAAIPLGLLGGSILGDMPGGCRQHSSKIPGAVQALSLIVTAMLAATISARATSIRRRLLAQSAAICALVAMTFVVHVDGIQSEAAQVPYPHVFGVIAAGLAVIACAATWLVAIPFASVSRRERVVSAWALRSTELFPASRDDPPLSVRRIVGGFVTGLLAKPLQFLLLPAFAVLLAPAVYLWHFLAVAIAGATLLITAGTLTARWDRMTQYLRRYFLLGTPFAVSATVIVLSALRIGGVQYVTTLLDVAPFCILFLWMVMAYALCWWFEYHVNGILAARLLGLFGASGLWDHDLIPYRIRPNAPRQSRVDKACRYLTGHGMGELIVVGTVRERGKHGKAPAFHSYTFLELFEALLGRDHPTELHEITRRVQLYFALVNVLIAIGLAALAWHWGRGDRLNTVEPMVTAARQPSGPADAPVDLARLLSVDSGNSKQSAFVVAASGGGTRAALYTAMTLRGLHNIGLDKRIVLLSGVSGGAVASAYFYGHRDSLVRDGQVELCAEGDRKPKPAWECYFDRMTMPFIDDVLRGAAEWRIQSEQPLGVLLAESFERRLFAEGPMALAKRSDLGLILNTAMAGHPVEDAPALVGTFAGPPSGRSAECDRPISGLGGGRLAFSNLAQVEAFSKSDPDIPSVTMPFLVLRDQKVALARAAALSANFPPVFPNARVDITGFARPEKTCDLRTYYVTDGGAVENLSLVSALLAIDSALRTLPRDTELRDIDIVLAEASAFDFDYSQDRGVGAATGQAKERLTGRLTLELLERLRERVKINIHDLSLPRVFRSRGGFGTHWQWPGTVRLENPLFTPVPPDWQRLVAQVTGLDRHWVTINRDQLSTLWQALYANDGAFCARSWDDDSDADLKTVSGWICGHARDGGNRVHPDPHVGRWERLRSNLAAP
jgi:predicted acylesterase/phospholipase RssA